MYLASWLKSLEVWTILMDSLVTMTNTRQADLHNLCSLLPDYSFLASWKSMQTFWAVVLLQRLVYTEQKYLIMMKCAGLAHTPRYFQSSNIKRDSQTTSFNLTRLAWCARGIQEHRQSVKMWVKQKYGGLSSMALVWERNVQSCKDNLASCHAVSTWAPM
jgi:hypothetical protein